MKEKKTKKPSKKSGRKMSVLSKIALFLVCFAVLSLSRNTAAYAENFRLEYVNHVDESAAEIVDIFFNDSLADFTTLFSSVESGFAVDFGDVVTNHFAENGISVERIDNSLFCHVDKTCCRGIGFPAAFSAA